MLRVNSVKIRISENNEKGYRKAVVKKLHLQEKELLSLEPAKVSIDARKKDDIHYVCSFDIKIENEERFIKNNRDKDVIIFKKNLYRPFGDKEAASKIFEKLCSFVNSNKLPRPIIAGSGPCGLFCALKLAETGLKPLVIERGEDVDSRKQTVAGFWEGKPLNTGSNVQFGEGGAGTFSDGKLNTMVKDKDGRMGEVYRVFIENGADKSISYINKPHIGTDRLCNIVKNIRKRIIELGGEVRFNSCLTDIIINDGKVSAVEINKREIIKTDRLILAIGHSARDSFEMLQKKNVDMEKKSFAIGVRVQHPQSLIDRSQYGEMYKNLPAADYKLTCNLENGRSVYSFCMCPGGYVVNASSENGRLCVNGMSYSGRDGKSANSAIVVSVSPEDFPSESVLAGMEFQRILEEKAYNAANGKIPVQTLKDFKENKASEAISTDNTPDCKGLWELSDINSFLPEFMSDSIKMAFPGFGKQINGYDNDDTLLLGLESRTSSPVRIKRKDDFQSTNIKGLFPAGEGAGYAGGITSAAMDGLKVSEAVIRSYGNFT
ncbi:MAG: FAD-dependent oxidoreductase [Lachnospiraceae bacterium]|nr:FAD-dependent oxidoreductase [Lachnospiraceae bacterium]